MLGQGEVNLFPLKGHCWQSSLLEASPRGCCENLAIQGSDQSTLPGSEGQLLGVQEKKAWCHSYLTLGLAFQLVSLKHSRLSLLSEKGGEG